MGGYTDRETPGQASPEVEYAVDDIIDEETGRFVRIHIVCSCDEGVIRIDGGDYFSCLHCDEPCNSRSCMKCKRLSLVDYG